MELAHPTLGKRVAQRDVRAAEEGGVLDVIRREFERRVGCRDARSDGHVVASRLLVGDIAVGHDGVLVARTFHVVEVVVLEIDHLAAVGVDEAGAEIESLPRKVRRETAREIGIGVADDRLVVGGDESVAVDVLPDRVAVGERVERIGGDRRPFQFITFGELVAVFQIDLAVEKRIGVVGLRHDTDVLFPAPCFRAEAAGYLFYSVFPAVLLIK